ncbi:hypothetical protein ACOSQ4_032279 [Xanthoceras sorbifolium]
MREHLEGIHRNVAPWMPNEVRDEIKRFLAKIDSAEKVAQLVREEKMDNCVTFNSPIKGGSSSDSVFQRRNRELRDSFVANTEEDEAELGGNNKLGIEEETRD